MFEKFSFLGLVSYFLIAPVTNFVNFVYEKPISPQVVYVGTSSFVQDDSPRIVTRRRLINLFPGILLRRNQCEDGTCETNPMDPKDVIPVDPDTPPEPTPDPTLDDCICSPCNCGPLTRMRRISIRGFFKRILSLPRRIRQNSINRRLLRVNG